MKSVISEKGQITVPKKCRNQLGLKAGTQLDFEAVNGILIGRKVRLDDPIHKWRGRGRLPGNMSVDEYIQRIRS